MTARVVGSLFITATAAGVVSAATQGTTRGLMVFLMAVAIAFIAPTLFPILKQHGEGLAMGYVVARTLEVVFLMSAVAPLANLQIDELWGHTSAIYFCVSVVLLNSLLFRSKLVPRWISVWALIAVVPYLAGAVLVLLDVLSQTQAGALFVPLAINEMVLAVWLLAKGIRTSSGRA
ncbi:DUF4386 domain-containing protein [Lentzea sp. PSKA42]|uniref:DUF4386 domain-containing protein n=1 Tax=Lentzea indica TaxID=2604800 RepID=A0ABX1FRV3_9PSEU|nr:DUF4386 domain-containing protein [Lentzea indica]NKE61697.1 DUF4386 domain-containing protein [Lentzea indica]